MGALIDASVLIAAERGELDLEVALESMTDEYLGLSAITVSELLHGVHRADEEPRGSRREAYVEGLLSRLPVVPFDAGAARIHARLSADAAAAGAQVGAHDLMIAATAVSRGLHVVTRDRRSFPRIPGVDATFV